ncbi:hypothetical protein [Oceanicola granulosus]|uniref:hypothetical protein n=1 Tax=Oceanicola granulosus TaxID=252302 RepID=UPI0002E8AEC1|nr:hypothetical protein [Oceanicola granulosus]
MKYIFAFLQPEKLPEKPLDRFFAMFDAANEMVDNLVTDDSQPDFDNLVFDEYSSVLETSAEALGIHLPITPGNDSSLHYRMRRAVGKMKLENILRRGEEEKLTLLSPATRSEIQLQIDVLRKSIETSSIPENRKMKLNKKLEQIEEIIDEGIIDVRNVLMILSIVGAGLVTTTGFLADAPGAIGTITALIGVEQDAQSDEPIMLERDEPPKLLQGPLERE